MKDENPDASDHDNRPDYTSIITTTGGEQLSFYLREDYSDMTWLDGSARPLKTLMGDPSLDGINVRGSYDLAVVDHFPRRALDSYLVKMLRERRDRILENAWDADLA